MLLVSPMIVEAKKKKVVSKKTQKRHKDAKKAAAKRADVAGEIETKKSEVDLVINTYNQNINDATKAAAIAKINGFISYLTTKNASLKSDNDRRKGNNKTMKKGGSSAGVVTKDEKKKIRNNNNQITENNKSIAQNNTLKDTYTSYIETIKMKQPVTVQTVEEILAAKTVKLGQVVQGSTDALSIGTPLVQVNPLAPQLPGIADTEDFGYNLGDDANAGVFGGNEYGYNPYGYDPYAQYSAGNDTQYADDADYSW